MKRNTKRVKKAPVAKEAVIRYIYSVTCPHCKTTLVGGISENDLRIKCYHCTKPFDLVHKKATRGKSKLKDHDNEIN